MGNKELYPPRDRSHPRPIRDGDHLDEEDSKANRLHNGVHRSGTNLRGLRLRYQLHFYITLRHTKRRNLLDINFCLDNLALSQYVPDEVIVEGFMTWLRFINR